jgi:hypothetical protein
LLDKNIYCYEGSVISKNKLTLDGCPLLNEKINERKTRKHLVAI